MWGFPGYLGGYRGVVTGQVMTSGVPKHPQRTNTWSAFCHFFSFCLFVILNLNMAEMIIYPLIGPTFRAPPPAIWRQACSFYVTNPITFPNLGGEKTPPPIQYEIEITLFLHKNVIKSYTRPTGELFLSWGGEKDSTLLLNRYYFVFYLKKKLIRVWVLERSLLFCGVEINN